MSGGSISYALSENTIRPIRPSVSANDCSTRWTRWDFCASTLVERSRTTIPPLPVVAPELHWRKAIAVACCYAGPVEDGARAVQALRRFGAPLVDLLGPTPYVAHQSGLDSTVPHGWHYYWKATNLAGLSDDVIAVVADHAYAARSPRTYAAMFHMGGSRPSLP